MPRPSSAAQLRDGGGDDRRGRGRRRRRWWRARATGAASPQRDAPSARPWPRARATAPCAPLAHDDAAEAHTPARSSRNSSASLSTPSKQTWQMPGDLARSRRPVSTTPGTPATQPVDQPVAQRATRARHGARALGRRWRARPRPWPRCRRRCGCRCAARAPGRRRGAAARASTPSRTTSAPTPLGPPNLWALTDTRSAPARLARRRRATANACTASVCSTARGARSRTTAATSARGWIVPTSLLASITDTTRDVESSSASASASRSTTPRAVDADDPPAEVLDGVQHGVVLDGGAHRDRRRRGAPTPKTARLSASVPPPVNTTSPGRQPRHSATTSRASSTAWRASRAASVGRPTGCRSAR